MRPGEKLYEELNSMLEDTFPTPYEKIKIFTGNGLPSTGMEPCLEALRDICERRDVPGLVLTLKDLIPDYNPSADLLRRIVEVPKTAHVAAPRAKAANDRRRACRLRLELPVHITWRDVAGRQVETQGLTRDFSKSGIYFTAQADVNMQQTIELALKLPEEITPDNGVEVRYLTQSVRKEELNGTNGFTVPTVGVAGRFLTVQREAGKGGLAA